MVVDDEEAVVELVSEKLRREGYEVSSSTSGGECLAKISEEKPDLLLLDIMMPGMDGIEVCRKLKHDPATEDITIVMFTMKINEDTVKRSLECHADAYIDKPIVFDNLIAIVRRLLAR
jgi:CheY-like chemotaxis protein